MTSMWAVLTIAIGAGDAPTLTLRAFLDDVEAGFPSLRAAASRAAAEAERVEPEGAWDDPFVAAGVDDVAFEGGMGLSITYQLNQTIPFPGKTSARRSAASARAHGAHADARTVKEAALLGATQAYYLALYNQEALATNRRLHELLTMTLESVKARYAVGQGTHHEWLLAQVESSILDVERYRLTRERIRLAALMNELRARDLTAALPELAPPDGFGAASAELPATSVDERPELASLAAAAQAAAERSRAADLSYAPDFFLQGMVRQSVAGRHEPSMWGAMLGVSLPIFWFDKQTKQARAAELEAAAASSELDAMRRRLNSEWTAGTQQLENALRVVDLYEKEVLPKTELAASAARAAYLAQQLALQPFLETLSAAERQKLEHFAAKIDVELAKANLEHLLSAPPVLRLAPETPTLFSSGGAGGMRGGGMGRPSGGMGRGMGATLPKVGAPAAGSSEGGRMGGM